MKRTVQRKEKPLSKRVLREWLERFVEHHWKNDRQCSKGWGHCECEYAKLLREFSEVLRRGA